MNGSNALYTLLGTVLFIRTTDLQITAYKLLFSIVPNVKYMSSVTKWSYLYTLLCVVQIIKN